MLRVVVFVVCVVFCTVGAMTPCEYGPSIISGGRRDNPSQQIQRPVVRSVALQFLDLLRAYSALTGTPMRGKYELSFRSVHERLASRGGDTSLMNVVREMVSGSLFQMKGVVGVDKGVGPKGNYLLVSMVTDSERIKEQVRESIRRETGILTPQVHFHIVTDPLRDSRKEQVLTAEQELWRSQIIGLAHKGHWTNFRAKLYEPIIGRENLATILTRNHTHATQASLFALSVISAALEENLNGSTDSDRWRVRTDGISLQIAGPPSERSMIHDMVREITGLEISLSIEMRTHPF